LRKVIELLAGFFELGPGFLEEESKEGLSTEKDS
jgi:hypothetical protein